MKTQHLLESVWALIPVYAAFNVPLSAPGLISVALIVFAFTWNELLFALSLTYMKAKTITVVIAGAQHTRGAEFWYIGVRSVRYET